MTGWRDCHFEFRIGDCGFDGVGLWVVPIRNRQFDIRKGS